MPFIQTKIVNHIGTIAFDNYSKRNALGSDMIHEILTALADMENQKIRAIILRSAQNEAVWSAGHDVSELPKSKLDPLPYDDPLLHLIRAIRSHPAPVIAMVHGGAWGGACDLVVNCDIVIADETSAFAITPAKLGLPYLSSGLLHFMSRMPLSIVKEMFFSALPISAERALRAGLVNQLAGEAELEEVTYDLANTIASRSAEGVTVHKKMLNMLSEANPITPDQFEYLHGLRRAAYMGADYSEGIEAFLEKRTPEFNKS
ncbi:methylmalonyl-CoA decarboxylase [Roseibium sp. RKSG952]|uniref:methylmalonyl-CoA decarboxylase n=1 Tax=Roseibium sp. RKSG952 TaxID=2529384 RepID=UPI0012BBC80F|nr:methylmalonyl-CoA decarboxylase [Roseibium sp. RKSG952]MTH98910.1 methylmalonyl-CoA decarboxylase [Roseibium sp. RKSG952]